jgi:uncharacterized membrane protein
MPEMAMSPPDGAPGIALPRAPDAGVETIPAARRVGFGAPFAWLARGWGDMRATCFAGTFYGALFALMGLAIVRIYETRWQLTMGLTAGFFLVGPFVCCGIYWLSRQRESGERTSLVASLSCWRRNPSGVGFFAAIVTFAMIVWARVSVVIFALFSTRDFPTLQGVLKQIFAFSNLPFVGVWFGVGFVFASLVFAVSVVSVPMLLDRDSDTMMSIFGSVRALWANPGPLYLWAALIVAIVGASLLSGMVPLVLTAPLVGHATWHAYRDLIER